MQSLQVEPPLQALKMTLKISFSESPIYYAALKMFKIYGSTAVDSNNDEDEMDYSSEISDGEADW